MRHTKENPRPDAHSDERWATEEDVQQIAARFVQGYLSEHAAGGTLAGRKGRFHVDARKPYYVSPAKHCADVCARCAETIPAGAPFWRVDCDDDAACCSENCAADYGVM